MLSKRSFTKIAISDDELVQEVMSVIGDGGDGRDAAAKLHVSVPELERRFKKQEGMSIQQAQSQMGAEGSRRFRITKRAYPSTVFPTYGLKVSAEDLKKRLKGEISRAVANTIEAFLAVDTRTDAFEDSKGAVDKSVEDISKAILK